MAALTSALPVIDTSEDPRRQRPIGDVGGLDDLRACFGLVGRLSPASQPRRDHLRSSAPTASPEHFPVSRWTGTVEARTKDTTRSEVPTANGVSTLSETPSFGRTIEVRVSVTGGQREVAAVRGRA